MATKNVVMVVDDDPMNLQMAEFILKRDLGVEVVTADSGYSCIALLQKKTQVDLILLDIQMPRMDGFSTLENIKKHPEWKKIPVIFLTASADKDTVVKAALAGVKGYIKKPFMPKELVDRVGSTLAVAALDSSDLSSLLDQLSGLGQ
mgnify:CR=1 FL=1